VLVSFPYVLLQWLFELIVLRARSSELKELEIVVLRHELAILRRKTRRRAMTAVDLILNQSHLERILGVFVDHHNEHRPHRALSLAPPDPRRQAVASVSTSVHARILRRDRLGGVIHEYALAA
jgi:hypothetical protein